MNQHSLTILEFPKIVALIRGKCLTPYGAEHIEQLGPLYDRSLIERNLTEISQMKDIINFGNPFPLYRMDDSRELLREAQVEQHFLDPKQILKIAELVRISIEIENYDREGREKFPLIAEYLRDMRGFPELRTEINRAIDENGEIKDNASKQLREIRQDLSRSKQKITSRLQSVLSGQTRQPGWQDDIVTLRNERYVIGIPTSQYRADMGILHDRSQTGATFYVEPNDVVELNNRINMLHQEEREEIIRILRAITAEIGRRAGALLENCRLMGKLDAAHACAGFSNQIKGNCPVIVDNPDFNLINARHPLLMTQFGSAEKVVANSIGLDDNRQAILITGPNTGGKTVLLKTIGLSILMAQSGLHIAADEKSEVGIFREVFADIGDEQSIEQSLSTFSSHITNIITALSGSTREALLLFDEIGAGTDPKEGSALAESVILYTLDSGARLIVTTHYSQLKTLAMEYSQIENASLQFDRETLAPTFQLRLGLPGASYAVEIAGRLGMPESICKRASSLLGSDEKSLDSLIAALDTELRDLKKTEAERLEKMKAAQELEKLYRTQTEHLKKEVEAEKKKALSTTVTFLDETRRDIERLVADIRKSEASPQSVKEFHRKLKDSEKAVRKLISDSEPTSPKDFQFARGDWVEIISLAQQGTIEELVGKDKARIKVGNVFTTVELRNLKKTEGPSQGPRVTGSGTTYGSADSGPEREIHLLGMTGEEAIERLERFLDQSVVHGLPQVYVVHGKGTGALRRKLTDYLKNHPEVVSVRLGDWNEGGAGVTVVKLKT